MNTIFKLILFPFSLLYGLVIAIRNFCYNVGLFASTEYKFPTICIGNLSVGGTGKTPHTEFIIRLLQKEYQLATLSRGYGRETKGFRIVDERDTARTVGDEPFQFYKKFKGLLVAVDEKRKRGIKKLRALDKPPSVILLDDAFQHRSVKAGLSILLTDYSKMYIDDLMLPSGRLRENKAGAKRADIIVITKCPTVLSPIDIRRITSDLKPKAYQKVFFSYITYQKLTPLNQTAIKLIEAQKEIANYGILLVSAIANPEPLKLYLKRYSTEIVELTFKDHHFFTEKDYRRIKAKFQKLLRPQKAIVMTEKDAAKFDLTPFDLIPVFSLPICVQFHNSQGESFVGSVRDYLRSY